MPPKATSVPTICCLRRRSAPSAARMPSVNSGWQVSTSEEEKAVERFMPYITALMCTTWPTKAHSTKRGKSARRGQLRARLPRKATASRPSPRSGNTEKRRNMKVPTPMWPSTYFTKAKFMPQASMVKIAAARAQSSLFTCGKSRIPSSMKVETILSARSAVRELTASKIREVVNEGMGREDVLPFWVGEPDEPTPQFIRQAGIDSIAAVELFYTYNLGIPSLREALAQYVSRLHRPRTPDEIAVTSSGVSALMLASQLLVDPGDRVVEVVPLWPNLQEIPKILGAEVKTVALSFSKSGWTLDLDKLIHELKPATRALYLNSPNNPTGWTVTREEQRAILEHCRRHGI